MAGRTLLIYRDGSVRKIAVEAAGRLRWLDWRRDGKSALLSGDGGTLLRYDESGRSFSTISSPTKENLRSVAFAPRGGEGYAVGNRGTVLRVADGSAHLVSTETRENLRRVAWRPQGDYALAVGNGGACCILREGRAGRVVEGAETNLRSVSWHPSGSHAILTGNCLRPAAGGLAPSSNLFVFDGASIRERHTPVESRSDLLCASWRPDGEECLVVGFDQVWHTPSILSIAPAGERDLSWDEGPLFPTACAWHPSGSYAIIGTGGIGRGEGRCVLYRYDGSVKRVADLGDFRVSCIAWRPGSEEAYLAGSSSIAAFSS